MFIAVSQEAHRFIIVQTFRVSYVYVCLKFLVSSAAMVDVDAGERSLERRQSFVLVSQSLGNRLVHLNIVLKMGKMCECFEMILPVEDH